ncbi:hypothetical protein MKEN_00152100 [Mycena kentingensis (nom. inval.)]|nr:hypothetical protein MKEN_00152100 [Mycena kentingensis (nom. inval.)]
MPHTYPPRLEDDSHTTLLSTKPSIEKVRAAEPMYRPGNARWSFMGVASILLHVGLVLVHAVLLVLAIRKVEQRTVFPISQQSAVALYITAIATGIAILYLTAAVFMTQKLAVQANLHARQTLTATHDNLASWGGLGAALNAIFRQRTVRASVGGTIAVAVYLAAVATLHISTPALFAVAGFNATAPTSSKVASLGLPVFDVDNSDRNLAFNFLGLSAVFFPWVANLAESGRVGLVSGTLYDTLDPASSASRPKSGNAVVSATGIEINCGYLPGTNNATKDGWWYFSLGGEGPGTLRNATDFTAVGPNITLLTPVMEDSPTNAIIIFTANEVVDSRGSSDGGHAIELSEPMGVGASTTNRGQFLFCSRRLVNQTGLVSLESGLVDPASLQPSIIKTSSSWRPYTDIWSADAPLDYSGDLAGDLWAVPIQASPDTSIPEGTDPRSGTALGTAEIFVMEHLKLEPTWLLTGNNTSADAPRPKIYLHDIENALSEMVATYFWVAGHAKVDAMALQYTRAFTSEFITPPTLRAGTADLEEFVLQARLELNLIAISLGLAASLVVSALAIWYAFSARSAGLHQEIGGTGVLHILWLSRNHPELHTHLPHVTKPTESAIRAAGMVNVRLADGKDLDSDSLAGRDVSVHFPDRSSTWYLEKQRSRSRAEQIAGISLHVFLVVLHAAFVVVIGCNHAERRIVYPIAAQTATSLWVTILSTGFGTIYLALILYLTQRIALQKLLDKRQALTATHDQTTAWTGLGAAFGILCRQISLPSSVTGALGIFLYLGSLAALHLTIPTMITVQTFNHPTTATIPTAGAPIWEREALANNASLQFMQDVSGFFQWKDTLGGNGMVGWANHTLYDVLAESVPGALAPIPVSAVAFSVSCGYPLRTSVAAVAANSSAAEDGFAWNVSVEVAPGEFTWFLPPASGPNIITTYPMQDVNDQPGIASEFAWPSLLLYATSPVLDSTGATGNPLVFPKVYGMNDSVSAIQIMQCTRSLVNTTGAVDGATRVLDLRSLGAGAERKNASSWAVFSDPAAGVPVLERLNDARGPMESGLWPHPGNTLSSSVSTSLHPDDFISLSMLDLFVMEELALNIDWYKTLDAASSPKQTILLHDLENALADFAACFYWIVGHIRPPSLATKYNTDFLTPSELITSTPPALLAGSTSVERTEVAARLNFNLITVSLGLASSILATLLALKLTLHSAPPLRSRGSHITTLGILQMVWLFRNNAQLGGELGDDVRQPTEENLRAAGMRVVRLLDD